MLTHISIFRDQLSRVFDLVNDVDLLDSRDPTNLQLLGRPDLNVTFTKFHCWRLTMYDKAVFLDADTLVCHSFILLKYTVQQSIFVWIFFF